MRWNTFLIWCFIISLIVLPLCTPTIAETFEPSEQISHYQSLLEEGLSIYEMERELQRIQEKLEQLNSSMNEKNKQIEQLQSEIEFHHEQAGEVLRQYYMGERLDFISILLDTRSISQFITVFSSIQFLLEHDRKQLVQYQESLAEQKKLLTSLTTEQQQWTQLKNDYITEMEQMKKAQESLKRELEKIPEAEEVSAEIDRLTEQWQQNGLPWFHTYFQTLTESINHLPEWVLENSHSLSFERDHISVHLTDDDFNEFLHEQNDILDGVLFQFNEDNIVVEGEKNNLKLKMTGRYIHEYNEEHGNRLTFIIDQLYFNDYTLPDTTKEELMEKFDLNFYPDQLSSLFKFKSFEQKDGSIYFYFQL